MSTEIEFVRAALARHDARTSEMHRQATDACCAACVFGHRYIAAADQWDRTRDWLVILLRKRGRPKDISEAHRLALE